MITEGMTVVSDRIVNGGGQVGEAVKMSARATRINEGSIIIQDGDVIDLPTEEEFGKCKFAQKFGNGVAYGIFVVREGKSIPLYASMFEKSIRLYDDDKKPLKDAAGNNAPRVNATGTAVTEYKNHGDTESALKAICKKWRKLEFKANTYQTMNFNGTDLRQTQVYEINGVD